MTNTVVKTATSKGQITIPKDWRDDFGTNDYIMQRKGMKITIMPIKLDEEVEELEEENETVLFDAKRDNEGKGLSPRYLINLIEKINKEEDNG